MWDHGRGGLAQLGEWLKATCVRASQGFLMLFFFFGGEKGRRQGILQRFKDLKDIQESYLKNYLGSIEGREERNEMKEAGRSQNEREGP